MARGFFGFRPFLEHIWRNLFELRHLLWRMDIRREFQAVPVRVKEIDGLEDAMMCRAEHLYISRFEAFLRGCLLYTSPSPRDGLLSRMPSSA